MRAKIAGLMLIASATLLLTEMADGRGTASEFFMNRKCHPAVGSSSGTPSCDADCAPILFDTCDPACIPVTYTTSECKDPAETNCTMRWRPADDGICIGCWCSNPFIDGFCTEEYEDPAPSGEGSVYACGVTGV